MPNIKFSESLAAASLPRLALWTLALALFFLAVAGPRPAAAAAGMATPQALLRLSSTDTRQALSGHLALLRDPGGQMTLEQIAQAGPQAFAPLPGHLSLGFTADAVWLRFVIERPEAVAPARRWLVLTNPLLQQATLHQVEGDGRLPEVAARIGSAREVPEILADRRPVFDLELATPGVHTYYLRMQSQASMALTATLWQPEALVDVTGVEAFAWGGMFGAYVLVIMFYLAFWAWTREPLHGVYVLYVSCNFLAAVFTGGWPRQLWPELDPATALALLGVWISLPLLVGSWFSMLLLDVRRHWPRAFRVALWILGTCTASAVTVVLLGHYQSVMPAVQTLSLGLIAGLFVVAAYLAVRGERAAWLFLGAFSFFYFGVAWRYLRNIGLLEPSFWNDNSYQIGAFVHMLVMSIGIFSRYGNLRRESEEALARATAEADMRSQQRDFMAMVSHEFRTPLSIIAATTHNLLRDTEQLPGAHERVRKVVRANDRMSALMETYLTNERLLLDSAQLNLATSDLRAVCLAACEDLGDLEDLAGSAPVLRGPAGITLQCDQDLLRIAVTNLLTNARRHSPPGAVVEVEVGMDGPLACVWVRDQGSGIAPEDLENVFKRFFRGRNAQESHGAGLGLYLAQVIAHRHGGTVTVRNLQPAGCEFAVRLPV